MNILTAVLIAMITSIAFLGILIVLSAPTSVLFIGPQLLFWGIILYAKLDDISDRLMKLELNDRLRKLEP